MCEFPRQVTGFEMLAHFLKTHRHHFGLCPQIIKIVAFLDLAGTNGTFLL
jgi:hypothetical protein